ncbi:AAA family ATPase [Pedobacter aquae]|uniref:AAA family ATPase n=1 Tax=Pedobacter aquae TaxID=2605747 RepID=A0A5C0VJB0_9SPHI|nr:AAA family ATPase [Pedobacter aquae]QEK52818.1 AAA family ATPase [Pedobacter aquae]
MEIRKAERKRAKIKMALQGSAGSGKTFSALLIAHGISTDWSKIVVIDLENNSADLYSHFGHYNVLPLEQPYSPEKCIQALELCEQAGMEVIIIDGLTPCWEYLLDLHANMSGNSFTNWSKITPRQNALVNKILSIQSHVISTIRVKQDYVLNNKDGKIVPEKVGLKAIQRDGLDYEFTIVLDIDNKHHAVASKDRTTLFMGKPEFTISRKTGEDILKWCNEGIDDTSNILELIKNANSIEVLKDIYFSYPDYQNSLSKAFASRKEALNKLEPFNQKT